MITGFHGMHVSAGVIYLLVIPKDRKFYLVIEARCTENGRCILVSGPKERVNRGSGFVAA